MEVNYLIWMLFSSLLWLNFIVKASRLHLHRMQLEGNELNIHLKEINKNNLNNRDLRNIFILILTITFMYLLIIISTIYRGYTKNTIPILYFIIWALSLFLSCINQEKLERPFKFTNRAKRLFITNIMLNLILLFIVLNIYITSYGGETLYLPFILFIYALIYFLQPYIIYFSNIIVSPLEMGINKYYIVKAQSKIESLDKLQVVGITGSLGKTSTKLISTAILKHKYRVLNIPENHNTFLDISRTINEKLNNKHQILIVEMDTKNIGDIRKLSTLVKPNIGVITTIEQTNLVTFKNIDNVMKAKYEIVEALPADGLAVFNYDNEYVKKLADKTFKEKILYGMNDINKLDIYAENIEVTEEGMDFTIKDKDGHSIKCSTKFTDKYDIYNILAGVSIAYALGLNFNEIKKGISKLESIFVET